MAKSTDDPTLSKADRELFRRAMTHVTPLQQNNSIQRPRPRPQPPRSTLSKTRHTTAAAITTQIPFITPDNNGAAPQERLTYQRPGVQHRVISKLRKGQPTPGAILDLHGMTRQHAVSTLHHFLTDCQNRRIQCVKIIHGKGKSILKQLLNQWLQQQHCVRAFCSARHNDGGSGAVYVLLRQPNRNN